MYLFKTLFQRNVIYVDAETARWVEAIANHAIPVTTLLRHMAYLCYALL